MLSLLCCNGESHLWKYSGLPTTFIVRGRKWTDNETSRGLKVPSELHIGSPANVH